MNSNAIREFLKGEKFSNSLKIKISEPESSIHYRMEYLERMVTGKRVIHLGFADHMEVIQDKMKKGIWLHGRLQKVTERCTGIDINPAAVTYLSEECNIEDIFCLDITRDSLPQEITEARYDYLILGELIEHIDNPVLFLEKVKQVFGGLAGKIVITAPNAFRWNNVKSTFRHVELINSDHRYWYTPYTLSKILSCAGFDHMEFVMAETFRPLKPSRIKNMLFRKFPAVRDTIIMTGDFMSSPSTH